MELDRSARSFLAQKGRLPANRDLNMKHRNSLLSLLCIAALMTPFALSGAAEVKRPNFIFIIADDMYREMFNCTPEGKGHNVTPTLDRLAAEGVVMQGQHIVSPVCTPSRFNCLTGRYASRARNAAFTQMTERGGMSLVVWNTMLLADDLTLPRLLQKAGYTTGTVGKHHCVGWPKLEPMSPADDARTPAVAARLQANGRQMEAALRALGFDFATNIISGNLDERYPQNAGVHNLDWLVSGALDFIDRNKDTPFFLYFASSVAHSPNQPKRSWNADPRATPYGFLEKAPEVLPARDTLPKRIQESGVTGGRMSENVLWLDDAVGALIKRLEKHGLADNTLVVFFNDNGQDAKGSIYQGGTHCPSILWRKGGFPCGRTTEARVTNLDFAPTLLDLAGAELPQGFFDGRSFRPLLEGKSNRIHDALFFELGFTRGVLKDHWKYVALRYPPNPETIVDLRKPESGRGTQRPDPASPADLKPRPPFGHIGGNNNEDRPKKTYPAYWDADQLYDLSADPNEQRNLAKDPAHAAKLEELKRELRRHLEKLPGGFAELKTAP
jgi:arylsulfatase A